jgi:hypothetical protein
MIGDEECCFLRSVHMNGPATFRMDRRSVIKTSRTQQGLYLMLRGLPPR